MKGTLIADFAGTPAEAKDFAKAHGLKRPHGFTVNGDCIISLPFKSHETYAAAVAKFDGLGWPIGALQVTRHSFNGRDL